MIATVCIQFLVVVARPLSIFAATDVSSFSSSFFPISASPPPPPPLSLSLSLSLPPLSLFIIFGGFLAASLLFLQWFYLTLFPSPQPVPLKLRRTKPARGAGRRTPTPLPPLGPGWLWSGRALFRSADNELEIHLTSDFILFPRDGALCAASRLDGPGRVYQPGQPAHRST